MKKTDYFNRLLPELIKCKAYRKTGLTKVNPFTITFSITAACQSRCKTCKIGQMYHDNPDRKNDDLTVNEIEKIFKTMRPLYYFNVSGGEPFLRDDLPEIVDLACYYLKPKIVHIPTNALLPQRIYQHSSDIIKTINQKYHGVELTVKPSIDGVNEIHDEIRGVKGGFRKLTETIELLKQLDDKYDNFHLDLGTVVSNYNIDYLDEIEDFVHSLNIESYRNEIAEQRAEFFNIGDPITPSADVYENLMEGFSEKIYANIKNKKSLTRTAEALRLTYYKLVVRILKEQRQVIPCYALISKVHINYDGGVWPCSVLGYDQEIGNLRNYDYDFQELWYSKEANRVREYIKNNNCACPLASQAYCNILLDTKSMVKVLYLTLLFKLKR